LKASPQYNRVAALHGAKIIDVFDFNNTTGVLSNLRTVTIPDANFISLGMEFSPDGSQLYCTAWDTAKMAQYDLSVTPIVKVGSTVPYISNAGGGGLKLGPDGKIYVTRNATNRVGVISDPDSITDLSSRYDSLYMTLGVTYNSLQFSTGLTRPALMSCNMNAAPVTKPDTVVFCVSEISRTSKAAVLINDTDADVIYVTRATFVNPSDSNLAELAVNATSDTVILTLKPGVVISGEHIFDIIYDVKDNGLPASQCATGSLRVKAYPAFNYPDIRVSICPDAGTVKLSKYIDTVGVVDMSSIQWTSRIPGIPITQPYGEVSTADLSSARVHTFTYKLSSLCMGEQQRMLYLEALRDDMKRRLKDTVAICYMYADAIHLDQIFGIEANGIFSYSPDVSQHVSQSSSGATIMNGKAIYGDSTVPDYNYHGAVAKKIEVTYTPDSGSCLAGKAYTVVIILTSSN
jgi:hypothetical protein